MIDRFLPFAVLSLLSGCVSRTVHEGVVTRHEQLQIKCAAQGQAWSEQLESQKQKAAKEHKARVLEREQAQARFDALELQRKQDAKQLADLEVAHAKVLNQRGELRLKSRELSLSYARMRDAQKEDARRAREIAALQKGLAPLIEGGALEIKVRESRTVMVIPMDPLFSLGEAQLSSTGLTQLRKVGEELRATYAPNMVSLEIQGHTDNVPKRTATIRNNWELCAARALAVLERFIEAGIAPGDLSAAAFGSFSPRADNATRQGRSANRRIEILISRRSRE